LFLAQHEIRRKSNADGMIDQVFIFVIVYIKLTCNCLEIQYNKDNKIYFKAIYHGKQMQGGLIQKKLSTKV